MGHLSLVETNSTTIDHLLIKELIGQAAAFNTPHATHVLNIGYEAFIYSHKLLEYLKDIDITLVDINENLLIEAQESLEISHDKKINMIQKDILKFNPGDGLFDIVIASPILSHLESEEEWRTVIKKLYKSLRHRGSLWICNFVDHTNSYIQTMMWKRYGDYLVQIKDQEFRNQVFASIEKEQIPRSLVFQLDLLKEVGFKQIDILHKNSVFAAFGGIKT